MFRQPAAVLLRRLPTTLEQNRHWLVGRRPWWYAVDHLEDQMRQMEKQFDRAFKEAPGVFPLSDWWGAEWRPGRAGEVVALPANVETFRLRNPIVEEDGVKKMKLEFDVRRFSPAEVSVKTNAKDNSLTIEAQHKSEHAKFEFSRHVVLPEGVKAEEVTCKYTADGMLVVQAPFTPPPEPEPAKDTDIVVKHE